MLLTVWYMYTSKSVRLYISIRGTPLIQSNDLAVTKCCVNHVILVCYVNRTPGSASHFKHSPVPQTRSSSSCSSERLCSGNRLGFILHNLIKTHTYYMAVLKHSSLGVIAWTHRMVKIAFVSPNTFPFNKQKAGASWEMCGVYNEEA